MAAEPQPKIFCLFHRKTDCICVSPVTDKKALKLRLEHAIRLNDLNNKYESNDELKAQRIVENEDLRTRLKNVED